MQGKININRAGNKRVREQMKTAQGRMKLNGGGKEMKEGVIGGDEKNEMTEGKNTFRRWAHREGW